MSLLVYLGKLDYVGPVLASVQCTLYKYEIRLALLASVQCTFERNEITLALLASVQPIFESSDRELNLLMIYFLCPRNHEHVKITPLTQSALVGGVARGDGKKGPKCAM